jgi:poly(3-hydroxybutyrate) depolymerase
MMTRVMSCFGLVAALLWASAQPAAAEMIEKSGRFGGMQVTYKVVLPNGYDASRTYPVILVFTGGGQQLRGAENTLKADWQQEAERRGYIVISPGSPDGQLFFQGADAIFPEFLDMIEREYRVPRGKLHIAGHSNGGLSAFHIAAKHPAFFATVTGYPGLLDGQRDPSRIQALRTKCLFMHVGDQDGPWLTAMQEQAGNMRRQGFKIQYTVEKNQIHRLRAQEINLSPRLFDQIQSCQ